KPGPLEREHRLGRALCLARLGNHKLAFRETQALVAEANETQADRWAYDLARVGGLGSSAAAADPESSQLYVATGIEHLRRAPPLPTRPEPLESDLDLTAFKSHASFSSILAQWNEKWGSQKSMASTPPDPGSAN